MKSWVETNNSVFCRGYNEELGRNEQQVFCRGYNEELGRNEQFSVL